MELENGSYDKEKEKNGKASPFFFFPGMGYKMVKKKNMSLIEYRKIRKNGSFTRIHTTILRKLITFGYLNAYLLREIIYQEIQESIDSVAFRKILKKMVIKGLLIQYEFQYSTEKSTMFKGSPFIYALSESGKRFAEYEGAKDDHWEQNFSIAMLLNRLAFNQFYIMLQKQFQKDKRLRISEYFGRTYRESGVEGFFEFRTSKGESLRVFVFPIRQLQNWEKKYAAKLRDLFKMIEKYNVLKPMVVVICETEQQAMSAERYKRCEGDLKEREVYYVCDNALVEEEGVFERLIEVLSEEDYSKRNIFKLNL